jgi:hypothetical protein
VTGRGFAGAALVAVTIAGVLLAATPARAAVVEARVFKGADRVPVSGQSVTLHVVRQNEEIPVPGATRTTDSNGRISFENVPDGADLEYYVATEFAGAFYTEGPVERRPDGSFRQDLAVFDVGKEIDKVEVVNHHIIVERKDDGLQIHEILIIDNKAPTAYLGIGANHAENAGMRLGLPASVKDFHAGMGAEEGTLVAQGREMMSLRPIPPGQRPLSFSYRVPLSGRMDLSHRFYFPTRNFVVMIDDPRLKLESKALTYGGSREQGGKKYEIYNGSNLDIGVEVPVRVLGASFWSNPAIYPWLVAPFAIVAVLILARRMAPSKRAGDLPAAARAPAPPPAPAAAAAPATAAAAPAAAAAAAPAGGDLAPTYAYLLAALDRGRERGEISAESHALVRGNLKRRLEIILTDEPAPRGR